MIMISVNMIRNDKVKQVLVRFEKLSQWAIPILTFCHSFYLFTCVKNDLHCSPIGFV